ncbi:MAG: hypothetical protein ACI8RD_011220 [Bacillariaceae sp.]|jgi:hypothetical protein
MMEVEGGSDNFRRNSRQNNNNNNNNRNSKIDDATTIVERILCAIEQRGEGHRPSIGPLANVEIVRLSMLCAELTEQRTTNGINNNNNIGGGGGDCILNEDLGFADVDADMMAQLVEYLEKHVAIASGIDFIQSAYDTIQKLKSKDGKNETGCKNIDEVRYYNNSIMRRRKKEIIIFLSLNTKKSEPHITPTYANIRCTFVILCEHFLTNILLISMTCLLLLVDSKWKRIGIASNSFQWSRSSEDYTFHHDKSWH